MYGTDDDWWSEGVNTYDPENPMGVKPKKTNFWSNFSMGGFEDYETKFQRKKTIHNPIYRTIRPPNVSPSIHGLFFL